MNIIRGRICTTIQQSELKIKNGPPRILKYERFMILLDDDQPFKVGEEVRIIGAEDFTHLQDLARDLRDDKKRLTEQLELLKGMVEDKDRHIHLLEKNLGLKGRLRSVIKI